MARWVARIEITYHAIVEGDDDDQAREDAFDLVRDGGVGAGEVRVVSLVRLEELEAHG